MIFGAVLIAGGVGVAAVMVVGMLFFELLINMFAVVFTKDLRWYGPSLLDSDPGIRNGVLAATALGSILLVAGAVRRYGAETPPLPPGPPLPPAGPPAV